MRQDLLDLLQHGAQQGVQRHALCVKAQHAPLQQLPRPESGLLPVRAYVTAAAGVVRQGIVDAVGIGHGWYARYVFVSVWNLEPACGSGEWQAPAPGSPCGGFHCG
ncbi:hypothetical protein GCM10011419_11120 [Vogesella fluminis]|uniref:Uncharacterized protein n=1 Tax=Vogesella fluminis TaxID=1069161 RepID=A0ABQ3HAX8_9NEIS|nr:hypothetical protein GCM10011419_11120 [Vogesella fluminis]